MIPPHEPNWLDWNHAYQMRDMIDYYARLIALRKENPTGSMRNAASSPRRGTSRIPCQRVWFSPILRMLRSPSMSRDIAVAGDGGATSSGAPC